MNKYIISSPILYIGIFIEIITILNIISKYLKYKNKSTKDVNGFDICKILLNNQNILDINIIESTTHPKNTYNINRRTIRLGKNNYYSKNHFNLAICTFLTGNCILYDTKNNYIKSYNKLLKNIGIICLTGLTSIIISIIFKGYYATIGIILLILLFIYQYYRKNICNENIIILKEEIPKIKELTQEEKTNIIEILKTINSHYNLEIIIIILQICRLFLYLL